MSAVAKTTAKKLDPVQAPWITGKLAKEVLGVTHYGVVKLAAAGRLRIQALPGVPVKYSAADVLRVRKEMADQLRSDMRKLS